MASLLYRLGRAAFTHRRIVVSVWVLVLAVLGGSALAFGGSTSSSITIPGTEAQRALDQLQREFPQAGGATGTIVVRAPAGQSITSMAARTAVLATTKQAAGLPGAVGAIDPYSSKAISQDGRYGLITVSYRQQATDITASERTAYQSVGSAAKSAGLTVAPGGEVLQAQAAVGSTEGIGVVVALIALIVTFGSLVAAGMTMLNALIGVGAGYAGITVLSAFIDLNSTAPILALMLGLAVGIDYSLFISNRFRQHLLEGDDPREAAARAVATAGSAVVFAGATVIVALAGLSVVGIPFLAAMGLAAAATVAIAVLVAITLLPAILGFAGRRMLPRKQRSSAAPARHRRTLGFRWAAVVTRFRMPVIVGVLVVLGVLSIPVTSMRLALPDDGTAPTGSAQRVSYDLISQGFGPGFNGRLEAVVSSGSAAVTARTAATAAKSLAATSDVAAVAGVTTSPSKTTAIITVIPKSGPSSAATQTLVGDVRDRLRPLASSSGAEISLTGQTAIGVDVSAKLTKALPVYLLLVVGLSIVLLLLVFRSILVPIKAALGFLLTTGATFGITVAVFQWGWLRSLIGLSSAGPLVSFLPILMIGILFGLAMDYEVFLVSRMREDFVHGADAHEATRSGVGHGARVVVTAAIIMFSVFSGFVIVQDPTVKSIGFALAIGVAIDAFVVRLTLVPAVMSLLGSSAWSLPRWLDRALPSVDIEGASLPPRPTVERAPATPATTPATVDA